jgi:hypothetical protein
MPDLIDLENMIYAIAEAHKNGCEINFSERAVQVLAKANAVRVNGSASDFEMELYKLINAYVSAGLKKPDLVHKMEYVTQSCRVS